MSVHIATIHYLGEPEGDMDTCILCRRNRGQATDADVIEQIGMEIS